MTPPATPVSLALDNQLEAREHDATHLHMRDLNNLLSRNTLSNRRQRWTLSLNNT
jgi:hypothetical protein